jgi:hypothetical protein
MDFSVVCYYNNTAESNTTSSNNKSVQDCILVLEWMDDVGTRQRQYMDFLCDINKVNNNDYFFVHQVWQQLIQLNILTQYDSIEIWSDGGPHHFKTRYCQWMWHHLSTCYFNKKKITHNFFASYHGHSLADSHAGRDKQVIKSEYLSSQQSRMNIGANSSQQIYWGPASANDIQIILQNKIENTTAIVLTDIDRDPELKPKVAGLVNIKQYHCFIYQHNLCKMHELTADEKPLYFRFQYL